MSGQPILLLGMGAAKAGTSWLWDRLSAHPDCHMRAVKELHYFDTAGNGRWTAQIRRIEARMARANGAERSDLAAWLSVLNLRRLNLRAYANYLCGGRSDQRVVGEVTPSYALLPQRVLNRIGALPGVRMVYLLRDPVERLWSHVRMEAARRARWAWMVPFLARRGMERALAGAGSARARGDYAATLPRLDRAAGDRLHVMFHEDMGRPASLARLGAFLGIAPPTGGAPVNQGVAARLPEDLRMRARDALRPQYDYVRTRMGRLPDAWCGSMVEA